MNRVRVVAEQRLSSPSRVLRGPRRLAWYLMPGEVAIMVGPHFETLD
jgi:hypothetical protein